MANGRAQCVVCNNETSTFICGGCQRNFCRSDLEKHLGILSKQLEEVEHDHNRFREKLNDQKNDLEKSLPIQLINKWEEESINIIKQTAEQNRQKVYERIHENMIDMQSKLRELTDQITRMRKEDAFHEYDLNRCKEKLKKLAKDVDQPSNISIEREATEFIDKITVIVLFGKSKDYIWLKGIKK